MSETTEHRKIVALLPTATGARDAAPRLTTLDADALASFVIDRSERWWRRRPCALALRGRVPESRVAALALRAQDPADVAEVRVAILEALSTGPARPSLLHWLQAQDGQTHAAGVGEAILQARARLGDVTATRALATLAGDPWPHRRALGEASLDALIALHGSDAIARELGEPSPAALVTGGRRIEDRLLGVRLLHRAGGDVSPAFADAEIRVAHRAYELVATGGVPDDATLRTLVDARAPGPATDGQLWALCALHRRGHDICEAWAALGRPRVPLAGIPDDVRLAIVRAYVPGQPGTDPRWLVEAACTPLPEPPDELAQLARATAALATAGLAPRPPIAAGDVHQQGEGTYHVIANASGTDVWVSTLGPFATSETDHARDALVAAGFRWIDTPLGVTRVTGLRVYHFGAREPLDVRTLLFYWQD